MCVCMWVSYVCSVICQKKNEMPETKGEKKLAHTHTQCIRYPVGQFVTITISCSSDFFPIYCCVIHILQMCDPSFFLFFKHSVSLFAVLFAWWRWNWKMYWKINNNNNNNDMTYADFNCCNKNTKYNKNNRNIIVCSYFVSRWSVKKWQNRPDGFWFVVK